MPPKKSLADQIADLETTVQQDYDPEDISEPVHDNVGEHDAGGSDNDDAREHYVKVGKSSIRKEQQFLLDDPRYAGQRASRKDLYSSDEEEEVEEDDNDDNDDEEDSNSDEDDEELKSWDGASDDDENLLEKSKGLKDEDDVSEEEDSSDVSEDEVEDEEEEVTEMNEELQKLQQEEKAMISKMSQSAQGDIEKGQHVRQQLTLWENFLESRIRTQKVVELANQLPQHDTWPDFLAQEEGIEPDLDAAKDELRETLDELIDLRKNLLNDTEAVDLSGYKGNSRKRYLEDDDEYIEKLWEDISEINDVFVPFRDSTLEKWSNKVQVASSARLNKKFKAFDQNIMTQVSNIMSDKENLVRRTQLQRSEYRVLGKKAQEIESTPNNGESTRESRKADRHLNNYDVEIFDDNDFYQQLLRELIEARMVDTDDPIAQGMRWAAKKAAESKKKKRAVDRKASKGRKLRFDIHEKIQNFMAPIPTGTWHDEMTEELYSSLLGQKKMVLDEATA